MPNVNRNLNVSRYYFRDDEFYTPYEVVERELKNHNLSGLNIYCPFDDESSAFVQYLIDRIALKDIKSVTYTSLNSKEVVKVTAFTTKRTPISSGDFFGPDVQALLRSDEFDIIITNPPFSIISQFFTALFETGKKFIILGPNILAGRKVIRPYYLSDQIRASLFVHDESIVFNGRESSCTFWHNRNMSLPKFYYTGVKFDAMNYEFLENGCLFIRKWEMVPDDWNGLMAVPINGVWRINRNQFDVIGICGTLEIYSSLGMDTGKKCYNRVIIKRKK